jgi:uncharacterized membrane protein (UPF0127 family)
MYYEIYSEDKIISKKMKLCDTLLSKSIGFMFNFTKKYDSLILKSKNTSIHMIFVFFPLQVAWLNKNFEIVDIKKAYPFMPILFSRKSSDYILELKNYKNIKIGNKIKLKPSL